MKILSAFTGMTLQNTDEDILKNVGNQINLVTIALLMCMDHKIFYLPLNRQKTEKQGLKQHEDEWMMTK